MTKPLLKGLAGAAVLLLMSAHIASAGPDGTCEDNRLDETAASDYTKIAQAAPAVGNATVASATADALDAPPVAKKSDIGKTQTDSLLTERQSEVSVASVPQPLSDGY
jgi:hypothetical protein